MPQEAPDALNADLPRSPTGRVPQWVVDEHLGQRGNVPGWREPDNSMLGGALPQPKPKRKRRSVRDLGRSRRTLLIITGAVLAGWLALVLVPVLVLAGGRAS